MELLPLLDGDRIIATIFREEARILKKFGQIHFINRGQAARVNYDKEAEHHAEAAEIKTELEKVASWNVVRSLRDSFLNRGRSGQFTIGYPIPYAFEGHLREPRAAIINAPKIK